MAGLEIEAVVGGGLIQYGDGASQTPRLGRSGEFDVSELMPRWYELTKRGYVYGISTAAVGVTAGATNVSPLAAGTGQPIVGLYNPVGSLFDLVILKVWLQSISGTPGGAAIWNYIPPNAGITAAGVKGVNMRTMLSGGQAAAFINSALTGGLAAAALRPLAGLQAAASGGGQAPGVEIVDGDLIIPPGAFGGVAIAAAGTTSVLVGGLLWAEIPI